MNELSDLVARLRVMSDDRRATFAIGHYWNVVDEAAEEIERLRMALEAIVDCADDPVSAEFLIMLAREALRGPK